MVASLCRFVLSSRFLVNSTSFSFTASLNNSTPFTNSRLFHTLTTTLKMSQFDTLHVLCQGASAPESLVSALQSAVANYAPIVPSTGTTDLKTTGNNTATTTSTTTTGPKTTSTTTTGPKTTTTTPTGPKTTTTTTTGPKTTTSTTGPKTTGPKTTSATSTTTTTTGVPQLPFYSEAIPNGIIITSALPESSVGAAPSAAPSTPFNPPYFFSLLKTNQLGKTLLYAPRLSSTQRLLTDPFVHIEQLSSGTVCLADRQYAGHGRGGNVWESPEGCLCFTLKVTQKLPERLVFIQYLVALALVKSFNGLSHNIRLKWPNDIYTTEGLKIGGIVCKTEYKPSTSEFDVYIGIGINVSNKTPTTCLNDVMFQSSSGGEANTAAQFITKEQVLASFLNTFEADYSKFNGAGFEPFIPEYTSSWLHTNQLVTIEADGAVVRIKGLSPSGFLLAADEQTGASYELQPDGNSFDFFKGLIKRKL